MKLKRHHRTGTEDGCTLSKAESIALCKCSKCETYAARTVQNLMLGHCRICGHHSEAGKPCGHCDRSIPRRTMIRVDKTMLEIGSRVDRGELITMSEGF